MKSINRVESWTSIPAHFDELNLEFLFDPDPNSLYDIPMLEPCPAPPPLDIHIAQRASGLYVPHTNPLIAIDNFRFAVDKALRHPRAHDIERNVAMLTIEAVTLQLPFIREGLITDNY